MCIALSSTINTISITNLMSNKYNSIIKNNDTFLQDHNPKTNGFIKRGECGLIDLLAHH